MPLQNTFAFVTKLQEYRAKLDHLPLQRLTRFRWHLVTQLVRERNYFLNQLFLKFSAFGKGQPFSDTFGATAVAVIEEFMTPDVGSRGYPLRSPHLNLIERLWHYMRDNMTRSYFYVKLREQCEAIVKWLETLPIERFLSLMGLSP